MHPTYSTPISIIACNLKTSKAHEQLVFEKCIQKNRTVIQSQSKMIKQIMGWKGFFQFDKLLSLMLDLQH